MADMDEVLEQYLKSIKQIAEMSVKDKTKITSAGAKVMADKLKRATAVNHPNYGEGGNYGHLSDDVGWQAKNVDGKKDGTSTAGYGDKAFVARFLNDGTKFIRGDHYVEDARQSAQGDVLKAEAAEYKKLIKKIEGGSK
ncbi:HK97-gp10 family putative phage morphogenesis protein [Lacticaseibacillus daqingensis]|uniref:HK97-gp10 family putative phage morphogenesis protein n=1 Tax=Lacticaseibacillus daqingensis TaxID=2486014 RepID=UPI001CDBC5C8|nr:HK97-gp10 family putative phage morphogenesis protein [Lacticaseibacillus daqingensis]